MKNCHCGLPKEDGKIVCLECWRTAPASVRAQLKSLDIVPRRTAARLLLEHAQRRANLQTLLGI